MATNLKHPQDDQAAYLPTYSQTEFFLIYLGVPLFAFMTIYFAPFNVLDQWEWARLLCDEVWRIFPSIKREAAHSIFPQVRQFGACLVAALLPAQIFIYLTAFIAKSRNIFLNMSAHKKISWGKSSIISITTLAIACFGLIHEPQAPLSKAGRLMETQRFSSAFVDSGLLAVIPACLALFTLSFIGIFLHIIKKGRKS